MSGDHDDTTSDTESSTQSNNTQSSTQSNNTQTNTQSDPQSDPLNDPVIINHTLNETIVEPNIIITNQQGSDISGNEITHTTFDTTNPDMVAQIDQNLVGKVEPNYDDGVITESDTVLNEIKLYASKIHCSEFQGKGTIDDYNKLFVAASKIANEAKQMELDVDIQGFNEFGRAADELSELFSSFIIKLQNVSIINDITFLRAILEALKKINNLSDVFGRFKETILATTTIKIPKTAHDTKIVLEGVMSELNCAMNYISHFVNPTENVPQNADLSVEDKHIIDRAVDTIDNWNMLCEQGVSIALNNSPDIQYINQTNTELKNKSNILKNATLTLKLKLANYNIRK
jgi:hypothetical protein